MNEVLKVFKENKYSFSGTFINCSDKDIENLFQHINLDIVQYWIDNNFEFAFNDTYVADFLTVIKNEKIVGCTSVSSPNWTIFSPVDNNVLLDQSKYLRLAKLTPFI